MKTRIIFGGLAAVLLCLLLYAGPSWMMSVVVLGCALTGVREYDSLFYSKASRTRRVRMMLLVAVAILALEKDVSLGWIFLWLPFVFLGARYVFRSNESGEFEVSVRDFAFEFLGVFYIVSLMGFIMPVEHQIHGRAFVFLLFLIVFSGDTFAYFIGMRFGRSRLASRLSPKKSVEGAAAAILASLAVTWAWQKWIYTGPRPATFLFKLLAVAVIVSSLAQMSDLFESMLKRSRAQKDSGSFIPGHGGILDRLDGLALAAPAFYFLLIYFLAD